MNSFSTHDDFSDKKSYKVVKILDYNTDDLGEVAEWVSHTANHAKQLNPPSENSTPKSSKNSDFDHAFDSHNENKPTLEHKLKEPPIINTKPKEKENQKQMQNLKENVEIDHLEEINWEEISKRNLQNLKQSNILLQSESDFLPVYFPEMWSIIKNLDLSKEKKNIITSEDSSFSFSLFKKLFPCALSRLSLQFLTERDQIFAYAKVQFDDKNPLHFRILYTIYKFLTNKSHCIRYGDHWEAIGFQGRDPATDLRGVGMLGVLQMLAFVSLHGELLNVIYKYSRDENFHFPLAAALLNITEIVLDCVRKDKLNNLINRQKSVINGVNCFYFAVMFKLFVTYRNNKLCESDFGELKKKISEIVERNVEKTVEEFRKGKDLLCKLSQ